MDDARGHPPAYGEWPLSGGTASPCFQQTALARIRRRGHDHRPLSAPENAIEIIRAYNGGGSGSSERSVEYREVLFVEALGERTTRSHRRERCAA